ncbi:methyltransferase family protein [Croceitalea marina]|uniref:Methyltransferase family protein n=1 Tax=Croceitalea marina TaxID=1775166 RepID=A0ABW5MUN3_9FLAO
MKFKIPPALVALIFGSALFLLAKYLPVGEFEFFGREILAFVVLGLGFLVVSIAIIQFYRKKTTVDPLNPEKANVLVTSGIFRFTRNPMYLGMLLFLIAFALKLGNAFNTLILAGFVYYMNHFQIRHEEEALLKIFGKEYKLYLKATRRWF